MGRLGAWAAVTALMIALAGCASTGSGVKLVATSPSPAATSHPTPSVVARATPSAAPAPQEILFTSQAALGSRRTGATRILAIKPDGSDLHAAGTMPPGAVEYARLSDGLLVYSRTLNSSSEQFSGCGFAGCTTTYGYSAEDGIATAAADGSSEVQLTSKGYDTRPELSPDKSHIAFLALRGVAAGVVHDNTLVVMGSDGSNPRSLTPAGSSDEALAWSPEGARLAVARRSGAIFHEDLVVVDLSGTVVQTIVSGGWLYSELAWSHDGARLAALRDPQLPAPSHPGQFIASSLGDDLWSLPVAGGPPRQLTHLIPDHEPAFQSCGASGTAAVRLAEPAWSPDDLQVAFQSNVYHSSQAEAPNDVLVIGADGSGLHVVYHGSFGPCARTGDPNELVHVVGWQGGPPPKRPTDRNLSPGHTPF